MKILVTGGAGFIGGNFVHYMVNKYPEDMIVNLDKLTYAGNLETCKPVEDKPNYKFIKGDIADREFIFDLFEKEKFDVVVNFAAESHVDRSIEDPEIFVKTNVMGTTTLLDAWSAGISSESLSKNINGKWIAVAATVIGMIGAIVYPMDDITDFLYLIGSVFAPMIAVQIADFFILKKKKSETGFDWCNLLIWLAGFILYRVLMNIDMLLGNTLPDMVLTILLCMIVAAVRGRKKA